MKGVDMDIEDKLKQAISKWANSLDVDQLKDCVEKDLLVYYTESADEEEALEFITEMEI